MLAKSAAVVGDAIWIAGQTNDLAPIDAKTRSGQRRYQATTTRIAYGFDSIWAVGHQGEPLDRVDPATGQIVAVPISR